VPLPGMIRGSRMSSRRCATCCCGVCRADGPALRTGPQAATSGVPRGGAASAARGFTAGAHFYQGLVADCAEGHIG
jgi:hypothetical protein